MNKKMINIMMAVALALTACSKDDYVEPKKDWDASTEFFASQEVPAFDTYFSPSVGYVGDPMPMYDSKTGEYKIYYLWDYRGKRNYDECYHPMHMVSTKDGASFSDDREVIPTGGQKDQDGTLAFGPATIGKFTNTKDVKIIAPKGAGYDIKEGDYTMLSRLEYHNLLTFDVKLSDLNGRFSIDFVRGTDSNVWYSVQVNADEKKANFEKRVKKVEKKGDFEVETYESTFLLDSQFKQPDDGVYHVTVCTDQSVCVVYINDELSFTNRIYNLQKNPWSISAVKGNVKVENVVMKWY